MDMQNGKARKVERNEGKAHKRESKKRAIAKSALSALKSYGYARTTLRDIAEKSDLSLGMVHYYFEDKEELLIFCVRLYKEEFIQRMKSALLSASSESSPARSFASVLATTIVKDSDIHRLWYDIRVQSMFDPTFEPFVRELENSMMAILRTFCKDQSSDREASLLYAKVDGVFRFLLQQSLFGAPFDRSDMEAMFVETLLEHHSA